MDEYQREMTGFFDAMQKLTDVVGTTQHSGTSVNGQTWPTSKAEKLEHPQYEEQHVIASRTQ